MIKRNQSEQQLANLKPFTVETAREFGARGGKKKKENEPKRKAIEAIKNEIIEKSFSKVLDKLNDDKITFSELKEIFARAVDMSGFKQQKEELKEQITSIVINREIVDIERD